MSAFFFCPNCEQPITDVIVKAVNELIAFREGLGYSKPQVGDIVQYEDINGEVSEYAHIESIDGNKVHICKHPHVPFIWPETKLSKIMTSTSGGDWTYIFCEDMLPVENGRTDKKFCSFFGNSGANKAVHFKLPVNTWRYKEIRQPSEVLFEACRDKRVKELLDEVKQTRPKDIYEALKILTNAFNFDRCFNFSPMFNEERHAFIRLFERYDIYCYTDSKEPWAVFDKLDCAA